MATVRSKDISRETAQDSMPSGRGNTKLIRQQMKTMTRHWLNAIGRGTGELMMNLPKGKRRCKLYGVLFVPSLSYNLLSISKISKMRKVAKFSESGCQITNSENKLIACASKCGSLYFLECESRDQANTSPTNEEYGIAGTDTWGFMVLSRWQLTVW